MRTTLCLTRVGGRLCCGQVHLHGLVGFSSGLFGTQQPAKSASCTTTRRLLARQTASTNTARTLPPPFPPCSRCAASFGGTMRSNTDQGMQRLRRRLEELVAATAAAHGCTAEVGGSLDCAGEAA
jgi:hypothetical protein